MLSLLLIVALLTAPHVHAIGRNCPSKPLHKNGGARLLNSQNSEEMPPNLKVAFVGDQGAKQSTRDVYALIKKQKADFLLIQGDFDYKDDPELWMNMIDEGLGEDFPVFASIGNHDVWKWLGSKGYRQRLIDRFERQGLMDYCDGDNGANMVCKYKGLLFVLSGISTWGFSHVKFVREAFSTHAATWKFCSWHKNHQLMQIGGKWTEVGWDIYDACREAGAIVATGHEHSYSRTWPMKSYEKQEIAGHFGDTPGNPMVIEPGVAPGFVQGVGGQGIRIWYDHLRKNPWWASVGAKDNNVDFGSLFCTFNIDGNKDQAYCEFVLIDGTVWDRWWMRSRMDDKMVDQRLKSTLRHEPTWAEKALKWIERQITSSEDDVQENAALGFTQCQGRSLHPDGSDPRASGDASTMGLIFHDIHIDPNATLGEVHLQMFGADSADDQEAGILIRAERGPAAGFACHDAENNPPIAIQLLSERELTRSAVVWDQDWDEWEKHEVWVSPDLSELVKEVVQHPDWRKGDSIAFHLTSVAKGQKNSPRSVISFDENPCMAPSLTIELK